MGDVVYVSANADVPHSQYSRAEPPQFEDRRPSSTMTDVMDDNPDRRTVSGPDWRAEEIIPANKPTTFRDPLARALDRTHQTIRQ